MSILESAGASRDRYDVLVVGLGAMGGPMAANFARARQVRLTGFDPVVDRLPGAVAWRRAESLADGVVAGGVVLTSLPDIDAVERVCHELLAGPELPAVVVDTTTSDPERTRAVAALLADHGVDFLDAPVARGRLAAATAELQMTVGGPVEVLERWRPLLRVVATDIVHCGRVGEGQTMKILNNMVLLMNVTAIVEAIAVADRHGLDPATVASVLREGSAGSFALSGDPGYALENASFPRGAFAVDYALKDARLAESLAGDDVPVALRTTLDLLARASAEGLGDAYYPAIVQTRLGRRLDGDDRGETR